MQAQQIEKISIGADPCPDPFGTHNVTYIMIYSMVVSVEKEMALRCYHLVFVRLSSVNCLTFAQGQRLVCSGVKMFVSQTSIPHEFIPRMTTNPNSLKFTNSNWNLKMGDNFTITWSGGQGP
jgi:hypothetical protein